MSVYIAPYDIDCVTYCADHIFQYCCVSSEARRKKATALIAPDNVWLTDCVKTEARCMS